MLQQILNDMFIDPDLLAELDEEEKQLLFCKMREEQVRRWRIREEKLVKEEKENPRPTKTPSKGGKKVTFLVGGDGEPIVLVLGGEKDEDMEGVLEEKARKQAEMEADQLKKATEEELDKLVRQSRSTVAAMEEDAFGLRSNKARDPAREAVVQSLQEATQEMEQQIRALEEHEKEVATSNALPTPPPSPPAPSIKGIAHSQSDPTKCPGVTLGSYGRNESQTIKKLNVNGIWDNPSAPPPSTPAVKPPILSPKPNLESPSVKFSLSTYTSVPRPYSVHTCVQSSSMTSPPSSISSTNSSAGSSPPQSIMSQSSDTSGKQEFSSDEFETNRIIEQIEVAHGVAAHIKRFEQLSEGSLEALKTATLERAKKRRQREILESLRQQVEVARRQTLENNRVAEEKDDEAWKEQQRKAKEAETRIREIARRAREEHRRSYQNTNPKAFPLQPAVLRQAVNCNVNGLTSAMRRDMMVSEFNAKNKAIQLNGDINGNIRTSQEEHCINNINSNPRVPRMGIQNGCVRQRLRPPKPPSRSSIVTWFREEELPKGAGLDVTRVHVAPWFHGLISRTEAEEILSLSEVGSFLVRVSERIWGYAISYRAKDRYRHYLIDVTGGRYTFLGSNQTSHNTLGELVAYHKDEPITTSGGELLRLPCGQSNPKRPDHLELFTGTQYLSL